MGWGRAADMSAMGSLTRCNPASAEFFLGLPGFPFLSPDCVFLDGFFWIAAFSAFFFFFFCCSLSSPAPSLSSSSSSFAPKGSKSKRSSASSFFFLFLSGASSFFLLMTSHSPFCSLSFWFASHPRPMDGSGIGWHCMAILSTHNQPTPCLLLFLVW